MEYGNLEMKYKPYEYEILNESGIGFAARIGLYEYRDGNAYFYDIGMIADLNYRNDPYIEYTSLEYYKMINGEWEQISYEGYDLKETKKTLEEFEVLHKGEIEEMTRDLYDYYAAEFNQWVEKANGKLEERSD